MESTCTEHVPVSHRRKPRVSLDFSLTVKAATLIFISRRCSAIPSAKQGKSGSIYKKGCLGRSNMRAFHVNPNRKHINFINP